MSHSTFAAERVVEAADASLRSHGSEPHFFAREPVNANPDALDPVAAGGGAAPAGVFEPTAGFDPMELEVAVLKGTSRGSARGEPARAAF
jgi:hypothetical protein